jgi:hypothetical protein
VLGSEKARGRALNCNFNILQVELLFNAVEREQQDLYSRLEVVRLVTKELSSELTIDAALSSPVP